MTIASRLGGALLTATLSATALTAPACAADPAAPILEADRAFARMVRDQGIGPAFRHFSADAAVVLWTPSLKIDRDGWLGVFPEGTRLEFGPDGGMMGDDGRMGMTWGRATFSIPGKDGAWTERRTRYLTVWRLQPDGAWRFVADVGIDEPAAK